MTVKLVRFPAPRLARRAALIHRLESEQDIRTDAAERFAQGVRIFGAVYGEAALVEQLRTTLEIVQRLAGLAASRDASSAERDDG